MAVSSDQPESASRLHRRSLGVPDIVFFVVAASAPLTVVAGGVPVSFAVTNLRGIPIVYVIIASILLLFTVGYAQMSRYVTNAGAFYTYVAKGLNQPFGLAAAFAAVVAYNAMQVGIYGLYGFAAAGVLEKFFGLQVPWFVPVLVTVVVVGILGALQVDLNARVLGVLLLAEVAVVLVFDIAGIIRPAGELTPAPFTPSALSGGAFGAALCFVTASFMGFESAAIYGEEAKDPKRTVARATYTAVILIGVFYAFSAWATSMAVGDQNIVAKAQELGADLLFVYAAQNVGDWFADVAAVLFVTSLFAALLSFHNAVARYLFSLGRERVLPRVLARVQPRTGAPVAGSLAQTSIATVVVVAFAVAGMDPVLGLFTWLTNLGALGVIFLMALTSIAVVAYLRQNNESIAERTGHVTVAAALAAVALVVVFYLAITNFDALLGTQPGDPMTWVLPGLILVAAAIGLINGLLLKSNRPHIYEGIGRGADAPEHP